jgi:hypothetical protein
MEESPPYAACQIDRVVKVDGVWWAFASCGLGTVDAHNMTAGLAVSSVLGKMRTQLRAHYQQELAELWGKLNE